MPSTVARIFVSRTGVLIRSLGWGKAIPQTPLGTGVAHAHFWAEAILLREVKMISRQTVPILIATWLLFSTRGYSQSLEHDDVEIIHAPAFKSADEKKPELAVVTKDIIDKTNTFREKEGRSRVSANPKLTAAANGFAAYMARTSRFGHTADGSRPAERAAKQGYTYCIVAENIACEFSSVGFTSDELGKQFVEGWEKSPGHRKNMLDLDVTETGVAVARSETTGYYFAVQMFGRPKSLALHFKIANETISTVTYRIGDKTFTLPPRYTRTHEQCRPTEVTFDLAVGEKKETEAFKVKNDGRFAITQEGGKLRVKEE